MTARWVPVLFVSASLVGCASPDAREPESRPAEVAGAPTTGETWT